VIVDKLMSNYFGKGHTLYMDNYYNSIPLTKYLLDTNTNVVGTLRKNWKESPKEIIMSANLKKGEAIHSENGNIHVLK